MSIKPCPFCGYQQPIVDFGSILGHMRGFVECCGDGCGAVIIGNTEEAARKMWNRRDLKNMKRTTKAKAQLSGGGKQKGGL